MFKILGAKNRRKNLHKHPGPPFQIRGGPGCFSIADQSVTVQNQTRLHRGSFFVKNLVTLIKKTHFRNLVQSCTSSPNFRILKTVTGC